MDYHFLLYFFYFWPHFQDLSSLAKNWTLAVKAQSLNHRTSRKFPGLSFSKEQVWWLWKNYLFKVDIIFSEIFLAPYNLRGNYFDLEHSIEHISDTIKKRVINILTGPSAKTSQWVNFLEEIRNMVVSLFQNFTVIWNSHDEFSHSFVSNSLRPNGLQHTRLPCPSLTARAYSNSCLSSLWYHPTISSSVVPFFSCLQFFLASGSFPMSQFFASGGQSIGVSASASVLSMNIQDWFPLGWTGWISLQSRGLSRVFSNTIVQKHQFFDAQLCL